MVSSTPFDVVTSLDIVAFGSSLSVYIGLNEDASSTPLDVVVSKAMVAFDVSCTLHICLH